MPTIANGNEVEIHVPITGDVTITPSGGHVEFGCNPPSGTDAPASRKVYVAETITIPAGSQMFLRAVGGSATYTDVLGVDDRLQALVSGAAHLSLGSAGAEVGGSLLFPSHRWPSLGDGNCTAITCVSPASSSAHR